MQLVTFSRSSSSNMESVQLAKEYLRRKAMWTTTSRVASCRGSGAGRSTGTDSISRGGRAFAPSGLKQPETQLPVLGRWR